MSLFAVIYQLIFQTSIKLVVLVDGRWGLLSVLSVSPVVIQLDCSLLQEISSEQFELLVV